MIVFTYITATYRCFFGAIGMPDNGQQREAQDVVNGQYIQGQYEDNNVNNNGDANSVVHVVNQFVNKHFVLHKQVVQI